MYPRIGTTCQHNLYLPGRVPTREDRKRPFQFSLHRSPPQLTLGTGEPGAVVTDDELECRLVEPIRHPETV